MKVISSIGLLACYLFFSCDIKKDDKYIFFLHNRFLEEHSLNDIHPEYGRTEYLEIINEFEKEGFIVLSEKRNGNVNAREYAFKIIAQIDSLIKTGVEPNKITVVGTSKGGYIAQYVSTLANYSNMNFVFIASFVISDIQNIPEINFCGNILTIYEKSDSLGVSALERKKTSSCEVNYFKEIELDTGMGHGFLFKPLKDWIVPIKKWANENYHLSN
ncbi:MAG: hypothetical protein BalsKO_24400 [Balneolaceae bacterium]